MKRRGHNFLPTFIITIFFWLGWLTLLLFFSPESLLTIGCFFLFLLLASGLTFALLLANSRRGFLLASVMVLLLVLKWQKLANALNVALLLAVFLMIEFYLQNRR